MSGYQSGNMAGEMWVQWFSCCVNQPAAQRVSHHVIQLHFVLLTTMTNCTSQTIASVLLPHLLLSPFSCWCCCWCHSSYVYLAILYLYSPQNSVSDDLLVISLLLLCMSIKVVIPGFLNKNK